MKEQFRLEVIDEDQQTIKINIKKQNDNTLTLFSYLLFQATLKELFLCILIAKKFILYVLRKQISLPKNTSWIFYEQLQQDWAALTGFERWCSCCFQKHGK